jgi:sugar phosphate isomerase/epimerase
MRPGMINSFMPEMPFTESLPLIRAAGFELTSLGGKAELAGFDTAANLKKLSALLNSLGLTVDSVHAPYPEGDRLFSEDEQERQESLRQCRLALDAAAEIDGKVAVIHLIPYGIPPGEQRSKMIEQGRRSVAELAEYAAAKKVKLALENGQRPDYDEVLFMFLEEFQMPWVGLCYDSGHENVKGECFKILEKYGQRLLVFHIHDNTGSDEHLLPYEGNIPWEKFPQAMDKLAFSGDLVLEASMGGSAFKDPEVFLAEAFKRAGQVMRGEKNS